jgi:hypothetical protein
MKKPNTFIVGAPKSGTTALYRYLSGHPNICMSPMKEPHFFATDLKRGVSSEADYFSLWSGATDSQIVRGEASVWYLYSQEAIGNIRRFDSDSKIIAMLRNPVDLIYSKHAQLLYNCEEDEPDFERAWKMQEQRKRGDALPRYVVNPQFLFYEEIGRMGEQVERLLSIFPEDQVHIIIFEDFRQNTAAIYRNTLAFLGLQDDGRANFPRINENCVHRSRAVGRLLKKPPAFINRRVKLAERLFGVEQLWGIDTITRLNTKSVKRPKLSREFREQLQEVFRPDIARLTQLLGRDLSAWLEPRKAAA